MTEIFWFMGLLWGFVALVFVFLLLRVHCRIRYISVYGWDDYCYVAAFVCFLAGVSLEQVATQDGFGQERALTADQIEKVSLEQLAETILVSLFTVFSKASVGLFLLRFVIERWQKVVIWICIGSIAIWSVIVDNLVGWLGCQPVNYAWRYAQPGATGTCLNIRPFYIACSVGTIFIDLFFALLPWALVWRLSKPAAEKFLIAGSLSLGIIAAAVGCARAVYLFSALTPRTNVIVVVLTMAEVTATLVCVGIPASLPIYRAWYRKLFIYRKTDSLEVPQMGQHAILSPRTVGGGSAPGEDYLTMTATANTMSEKV